MAKKPTAKKSKTKKPSVKKSAARKPSPAIKTKRVRVDGAIAALDDVLHGIGSERAELIRQRVRAILHSFR